jgi:hypothetical protein
MTTPFTAQLGLAASPASYVPHLALAPIPRHPTMRRNLTRNQVPPTQRENPADVQRAGAVIAGLAASLANLDHFVRQMRGLGSMPGPTKQKLNLLINLSEEVIVQVSAQFDNHDSDSINALSGVLGQAAELLLQLKVPQIEASLKHMHGMATNNLTYTPAAI